MDQALQKQQTRDRVKRYRERQKSVTKGSATPSVTPAIILALADPVKRDKLTRICRELKARRLLDKVSYGWSATGKGITFVEVDKMLSALGG